MELTRRSFTRGMALGTLAVAWSPQLGFAQAADRAAEAAALRAFAEKTHPLGLKASLNPDWIARWEAIAADAANLSDGAYFVALRRALGWFKDGHTNVLPFAYVGLPEQLAGGDFGLSLPVGIRLFDDGAYVTRATGPARGLLGKRIVRIGALTAEDIMRRAAERFPGNDAWAQNWGREYFTSPALLQAIGAVTRAGDEVPFETEGGRRIILSPGRGDPKLAEMVRKPTAQEGWHSEANVGKFLRRLPERGAIYVSIDEMNDEGGRTFSALTDELLPIVRAGDAERLIIDLRRNGGGDNFLGEGLRKAIGNSPYNRPGGLYVLVGPATFSAAQNLVNRFERETFAIFAGRPTGGAPNHYGDAQLFEGAATGIKAIVSSVPWFDGYPMDTRPWVMPDLLVPDLFTDWKAGNDPALETVLDHRPDAAISADARAEDHVFYFRRASQSHSWAPFWRPQSRSPATS